MGQSKGAVRVEETAEFIAWLHSQRHTLPPSSSAPSFTGALETPSTPSRRAPRHRLSSRTSITHRLSEDVTFFSPRDDPVIYIAERTDDRQVYVALDKPASN